MDCVHHDEHVAAGRKPGPLPVHGPAADGARLRPLRVDPRDPVRHRLVWTISRGSRLYASPPAAPRLVDSLSADDAGSAGRQPAGGLSGSAAGRVRLAASPRGADEGVRGHSDGGTSTVAGAGNPHGRGRSVGRHLLAAMGSICGGLPRNFVLAG